MRIEEKIRTALLSMSAVTALVGGGAAAHIRPDVPDKDDPRDGELILIEVDSEPRENTLDGKSAWVPADVTLVCRAPTRARSRALAEAVCDNGTDPGTGLAGYNGSDWSAYLVSQSTTIGPDGKHPPTWYDVYLSFQFCFGESR
jgi:fructose-specific component phosphotransferase system IIB-like protein